MSEFPGRSQTRRWDKEISSYKKMRDKVCFLHLLDASFLNEIAAIQMLKSYEINKLLVLRFTWKPTVFFSFLSFFFFFQNQQVQAFLGECLSGPHPIIPSSSNSPISTISQRPVQSLCPTNRAKMIGLDCPCPAEMLYLQKKKKKPGHWVLLDFHPTERGKFLSESNDMSEDIWCFLVQSYWVWVLLGVLFFFVFFLFLSLTFSFFFSFLFFKCCWVDFHTVTN